MPGTLCRCYAISRPFFDAFDTRCLRFFALMSEMSRPQDAIKVSFR